MFLMFYFDNKPWQKAVKGIPTLKRKGRAKRNTTEKLIVGRQTKCEQMEVSIKKENKDKLKLKWACAAEAASREKCVWILSQDRFVVDLPCSDMDRFPFPAAEAGLA